MRPELSQRADVRPFQPLGAGCQLNKLWYHRPLWLRRKLNRATMELRPTSRPQLGQPPVKSILPTMVPDPNRTRRCLLYQVQACAIGPERMACHEAKPDLERVGGVASRPLAAPTGAIRLRI